MRIVGGSCRGRRLIVPPGDRIRPTSERAREALFDKLAHGRFGGRTPPPLDGAEVVDAFAGTGAMGLEALSRGAARATFLENARDALAVLRRNVAACGFGDAAHVLAADATRPPAARHPVDIVFLDPPFGAALASPALRALRAAGWIGPETLTVVEHPAREPFDLPDGFVLLETRRYGAAGFSVLATGPSV